MNVSFNKLNNGKHQVIAKNKGIEVSSIANDREQALVDIIQSLFRVGNRLV